MKSAIVFPGQGSQFVGMGKELFDNFSSAKEVFNLVDETLSKKLSTIMFEGSAEELTSTENTQPALMAVSIAIVKILEKEFNIKFQDICQITAGHSLGEYSALCASGAISLKDSINLLQIRGSEMAKCAKKTQGKMAAILGADVSLVQELVNEAAQGEVCQIANDNSVGQIVISGSKNAIERAIAISKDKGIKRAIELPVSGAFHSLLMLDATKEMEIALSKVEIKDPIIPVVSNVTAEIPNNKNEISKLLVKQITGSVRWRETMLFFEKNGIEQIIEIGAGKVLSGLVSRTCPNIKSFSIQNILDIESFVSQIRK